MKKITLLFLLPCFFMSAQQKTTGELTLNDAMKANLVLDNGTSTVFLTLTGPNDRWFSLQFGMFTNGMDAGTDVVYWNGTTLVDAHHIGLSSAPATDATNEWILISNDNNSPSNGLQTLVYSRAFNTGDSDDYAFVYTDAKIDLAYAQMSFGTFTLGYHGGEPNRGVLLDTDLTVLGVEDFSLKATQIYPNPSNGVFTIKSNSALAKITIYSHTGQLISEIEANQTTDVENGFTVNGLASGIYLINLENATENVWKKVIIE